MWRRLYDATLRAAGHRHALWFLGALAFAEASFFPIPYKVITIAAGATGMLVLPFVAASALGRGARFCLVAGLVRAFGPAFERRLLQYIDWIGWVLAIAIIVGLLVYYRL